MRDEFQGVRFSFLSIRYDFASLLQTIFTFANKNKVTYYEKDH